MNAATRLRDTYRAASIVLLLLLPIVLVLVSCAGTPAPDRSASNVVLIYGRPTCPNCAALKTALDDAGIAYTFYDIDTNPQKAREMWDKIDSVTSSTDSLTLPIVDVNGTILLSHPTTLRELEPYLNGG